MRKGIAVSPGVVVGVAYRVDSVFGSTEPQTLDDVAQVPEEVVRIERAVEAAAHELEAIVAKVGQQLGPAEADIFKSHLQMVNDQEMLSKIRAKIESQHLTALSALQLVLQDYAATFARIQHDYFRERLADVRDVISRIGSHLTVDAPTGPADGASGHESGEPIILVAHEIMPSQAMNLGNLAIAGIVTEVGGSTSHAAILSRSRGIPAVSGVEGIT
ncbi:MAG: phosphoenolpyruvate--protein phosphotransferase, partial [Thermoleophilia bacterium]|nr:phosphoenolpyruvate--protein phosphotransferase [Thermoleophilia bacterium]